MSISIKKTNKSVRQFTIKDFLLIFGESILQQSMDIYRFISILTQGNWISIDEQKEYGINDKIRFLYREQIVN